MHLFDKFNPPQTDLHRRKILRKPPHAFVNTQNAPLRKGKEKGKEKKIFKKPIYTRKKSTPAELHSNASARNLFYRRQGPKTFQAKLALKATHMREFDQLITVPQFGYRSAGLFCALCVLPKKCTFYVSFRRRILF